MQELTLIMLERARARSQTLWRKLSSPPNKWQTQACSLHGITNVLTFLWATSENNIVLFVCPPKFCMYCFQFLLVLTMAPRGKKKQCLSYRFLISRPRIRYSILKVKLHKELSLKLWTRYTNILSQLSKFCKSHSSFHHPRIYPFLTANTWFAIRAKRLKIGNLTKFNKFFSTFVLTSVRFCSDSDVETGVCHLLSTVLKHDESMLIELKGI